MNHYEREAWKVLLQYAVGEIERELYGKEYARGYNVTPSESRSIIGSARVQAARLVELAEKAAWAADKLDADGMPA